MAKFHYQKMIARGISETQAMDYLNTFSRDHARVPMQWNAEQYAGFSTTEPWLAVNPNYPNINAEVSYADPDSVFYHYQNLIKLRESEAYGDVLVYGQFELIDPEDAEVFAYSRTFGNKKILVIANFTGAALTRHYQAAVQQQVVNNYSDQVEQVQSVLLQPYQALVLDISSD